MIVSGRLNVLTEGHAGKGNAVLNIGPGKLNMDNSDLPLRLTGEAKLGEMILYAALPAQLSGPLISRSWLSPRCVAALARAGDRRAEY